MTRAFFADRVFTGESWLDHHAVIVEDGIIQSIIPASFLSSSQPVEQLDGCTLAPAFIDLQVYGAGGKLLAAYPETDSLFKLTDHCSKGGAAFCIPTVATNTKDIFYKCIDAVKEYWDKGGEGVLGLHLEGPWINPIKRGAHVESLIHAPAISEAEELLNYGKGIIRMITLAPEVCSKEIIDLILSHEIIISAGHSNATEKEARQAFDNGISTVTHLYNAMSPLHHRAAGLAGATMDHESVMASIIPDGYHVDYTALRIAKKAMKERLFVITDAVTDTTEGFYQHKPAGEKYEAAGILSGSALTMNKALKNLVTYAGIEMGEALRMCSLYPARLLNLDSVVGKILPGFRSRMVALDNNLDVVSMF